MQDIMKNLFYKLFLMKINSRITDLRDANLLEENMNLIEKITISVEKKT